MQKIIKILGIIILAIVIIGGVIMIVPKLGGKESTNSGTITSARTTDGQNLPASQELLAILQSVNTITLKDSVLRDPAFRSLVDISLSIQRSNTEGRVNPFADLRTAAVVTPTTNAFTGALGTTPLQPLGN